MTVEPTGPGSGDDAGHHVDGGSGPVPNAASEEIRGLVVELVARRRASLAVVVFLLLLVTIAFSAVPAIVGAAIDLATEGGDRRDLAGLVAAMVVATVVGMLGLMSGRYEAARFGESILDELRTRVYDATVQLPSSVVETIGIGELVARATGDVETLSNATRNSIPSVLFSGVLALGLTIALIAADWRLALVAVLTAAITAAPGVRWYTANAGARYRRERQAEADRSATLLEHYAGRRTLWAFGASRVGHDALRARADERMAAQQATAAARNRLRPALRIGQAGALAAVLGLGSYLIGRGSLSAGALTAASLYTLRLIDPVNTLLEEIDEIQQARAALERIVGLIELSERVRRRYDWPGGTADPDARPTDGRPEAMAVEIRDASFGYESDRPVLRDIDLRVPPGQRLLVVGPSGAGKSTLAGLICGTREPWQGSVEIGGVAITGIRRDELRHRVALVAQETHVFARSIRDNVGIGRPDAGDEAVIAALDAVDALEWVDDLDDGIDTEVSMAHPAITPARSQQLNLARVVHLDPPVVVLDEAVTDLEPERANRADQRLAEALEGRTVISIAHRLDVAPSMDRVVMMVDGRIVADGPHRSLVAAGGPYADLWATWRTPRAVTDTHRPSTAT